MTLAATEAIESAAAIEAVLELIKPNLPQDGGSTPLDEPGPSPGFDFLRPIAASLDKDQWVSTDDLRPMANARAALQLGRLLKGSNGLVDWRHERTISAFLDDEREIQIDILEDDPGMGRFGWRWQGPPGSGLLLCMHAHDDVTSGYEITLVGPLELSEVIHTWFLSEATSSAFGKKPEPDPFQHGFDAFDQGCITEPEDHPWLIQVGAFFAIPGESLRRQWNRSMRLLVTLPGFEFYYSYRQDIYPEIEAD